MDNYYEVALTGPFHLALRTDCFEKFPYAPVDSDWWIASVHREHQRRNFSANAKEHGKVDREATCSITV